MCFRPRIRLAAALAFLLVAQPAVAAPPAPAEQSARCREAAAGLIEIAKRSLTEPGARAKTIEKRRKLIEDWSARLKRGDDPCTIYMDIQRAATTF